MLYNCVLCHDIFHYYVICKMPLSEGAEHLKTIVFLDLYFAAIKPNCAHSFPHHLTRKKRECICYPISIFIVESYKFKGITPPGFLHNLNTSNISIQSNLSWNLFLNGSKQWNSPPICTGIASHHHPNITHWVL